MSISDMDLDLNNKIILISGENASGKSSIIDAISLCFISKKRSTSYQDYVKQGKEFATIALDCEVNNEPVHFDIQLNLVRGTAFQIALTYKNHIYNNKETEEIIESFGLDYYSDLMFSLQTDDDITKLTPGQRAYYLQKLLNFDFDEQKIILKKDLDQFDEILKKNNTELPLKQNYLEKEKSSIEELKIIKETEEDIKKIELEIAEREASLKEAEKNIEKLSSLNKKISELNQTLQSVDSTINTHVFVLKNIQDRIELNKRLQIENDDLTNQICANNSNIKIIEDTFRIRSSLKKEIENEIKDLSDSRLSLLGLRVEIDRLEKLYDEDSCPYCGQHTKATAEEQYLKYIKKQNVDNLLSNISTIMECKEEIYQKIADFEKRHKEDDAELKQVEDDIEVFEKEKIKINNNILTAKNKLNLNIETIKEKSFTEKDTDRVSKVIADNTNIKTTLEKQKETIQQQINKYSSLKISDISKEITLLKNRVYEYTTANKTNEDINKRNIKRNENIIAIQKEITELQERNSEVIKQKDTYEEAYKIFDKDLPNFMSIKACAALQDNINDFIQNIFPEYQVSLQASKKGCEFFYTVDKSIVETTKKNNSLINTKMSSGFEKALLSLAFKISLARMYSCNCLFLDEADGAADEENTQVLYESIIDSGYFDQLFLITHKNNIKEFVVNNYQAQIFEVNKGRLI
jgi:DNA repair exonuclease SbcCD ATPase subunit